MGNKEIETRPFAMFPDPREQDMLRIMDSSDLAQIFTENNPDLLTSAVYDILLALGDREKAEIILRKGKEVLGREKIYFEVYKIAVLRIYNDRQSLRDQLPYLEFCSGILGDLPIEEMVGGVNKLLGRLHRLN